MDKEQFRLQVEHNSYMRGVAASACKILVWSGVYAFVVWAVMSFATAIALSSKNGSDVGSVSLIVANILIIVASIILGLLVWGEVSSKIKEHRRISDLEDAYLGVVKPDNGLRRDDLADIKSDDPIIEYDDVNEDEEDF